ncbi:8-oxo-dGTP diphosphatase [Loktanella fryxellensis]|uniref:8-oxo-dGTP diphosphatase n=1 Tax=Loktanella fryxellensis TaxID=245187 RepID=A0A1H7ZVM7_9RHOB|nr:NUDIX hydrolase [Loktanella fryxellensis]SEM62495.1 8-oxo-dGTP diphosphatase [Loktanella fryxellensis]
MTTATQDPSGFDGAKVALFLGRRLLLIQRNDRPDIPWPGQWDFPGGRREGAETPFQTVQRETREEVGLTLTPADVIWQHRSLRGDGAIVWFFVARLPAGSCVTFGDEGQGWQLTDTTTALHMTDLIGTLQQRLALWIAGQAACDPAYAGLSN